MLPNQRVGQQKTKIKTNYRQFVTIVNKGVKKWIATKMYYPLLNLEMWR